MKNSLDSKRNNTQILDSVSMLANNIKEYGLSNNNTFEFTGVVLRLEDLNITEELINIDNKMFEEETLKKFLEKSDQEMNHYQMLKYALLQKIEFNKFYFNEETNGSRKLMVHSEDCISTIQLLLRRKIMDVVVTMRSSDVENLLLVDLYHIISIIRSIKTNIELDIKTVNLLVVIGSAHLYISDDPRREKI